MGSGQAALLVRAQQALGMTQETLGRALGVSRRTITRWTVAGPPSYALAGLVRVAHVRAPDLAREIAAVGGITLESVGIASPALAQAPPAPSSAASSPAFGNAVIDAVVCAAVEVLALTPAQVRPGLLAAFARAKELALTVDVVEQALRSKLHPEPKPPPSRARGVPARTRS